MEDRARIRINLAQREVEIEGSESFVERHTGRLELWLERFDAEPAPADSAPGAGDAEAAPRPERVDLGAFGEFFHHLPKSATEVDKVLAAGFYLQQHATDQTFTTAEANKRLLEHGHKVGNPSQCVRQSLMAKRLFMVSRGRYRISDTGRQYLRQLMGSRIPERA